MDDVIIPIPANASARRKNRPQKNSMIVLMTAPPLLNCLRSQLQKCDQIHHQVAKDQASRSKKRHPEQCVQTRKRIFIDDLLRPIHSLDITVYDILNLDKSISNVTREQPKLRSFISELEQEREKKLEEIKGLQSEIDGIYQQEDERTHLRDINARRGKVIGRISLWIESVENDTESDKQEQIIKSIEDRIQEIDEILDADSVEDRKQSALSRIQENIPRIS